MSKYIPTYQDYEVLKKHGIKKDAILASLDCINCVVFLIKKEILLINFHDSKPEEEPQKLERFSVSNLSANNFSFKTTNSRCIVRYRGSNLKFEFVEGNKNEFAKFRDKLRETQAGAAY